MTAHCLAPSVGGVLDEACTALRRAGVDAPMLDAQLLLARALGASRTALLTHPERLLGADERAVYAALVGRRVAREPLGYILGEREFYGRRFRITPDVLVPRPESELLIELALEWLRAGRSPGWCVDVGTGSGALAVTLAAEVVPGPVLAVDRDVAALRVAADNAREHDVAARVQPVAANLLTGLRGPFSLVVANLPYIPTADIAGLMPEVAQHEPHLALDGGADGLCLIRGLLSQLAPRLCDGGLALLELGQDQALDARASARAALPSADVSVVRDLAGHERVLRLARR